MIDRLTVNYIRAGALVRKNLKRSLDAVGATYIELPGLLSTTYANVVVEAETPVIKALAKYLEDHDVS